LRRSEPLSRQQQTLFAAVDYKTDPVSGEPFGQVARADVAGVEATLAQAQATLLPLQKQLALWFGPTPRVRSAAERAALKNLEIARVQLHLGAIGYLGVFTTENTCDRTARSRPGLGRAVRRHRGIVSGSRRRMVEPHRCAAAQGGEVVP
jgi:hypothetical protein